MNVLVTGASGQIGSYVLELLSEEHNVVGVDLKHYPFGEEFVDMVVTGDLRSYFTVREMVEKVDAVIHLAAQVSVERSWMDPVYDAKNNIISTINLLKASSESKVKKFIYISSAAVYGNPLYVPIDENHPTNPISPYGVSKLAGEHYVKIYIEKMHVNIVRPFNVYSERMDPRNPYSGVIAKFIERAKKGLPPVIYGDGEQTRDFIHARDVAMAIKAVLDEGRNGEVYNIGTGKETSILELAKMVMEAFRIDEEPVFDKEREGDIMRSCADISKTRALGFEPKTELASFIKDFMTI
ncbi:NAD-dependent epimerase/dehydratase family protein [Archaeoglobus neptunius]|uniref:NAD-dependent epimerase/dehydratase family protein n=1 Tax=Archaeoglobus neptunius TaxID=2798580 RepID=UPI001926F0BE|nr:NAD-dependent epimerase/dehydratase family protein [Archaeoglobus neptunius]